jgi:hypothetical protein
MCSADTISILVIGQIPLVWLRTAFEWALLVGTVVRPSFWVLERKKVTDYQPCGWLAQFAVTYAAQRLSGMTMIMTTYTGVRLRHRNTT